MTAIGYTTDVIIINLIQIRDKYSKINIKSHRLYGSTRIIHPLFDLFLIAAHNILFYAIIILIARYPDKCGSMFGTKFPRYRFNTNYVGTGEYLRLHYVIKFLFGRPP